MTDSLAFHDQSLYRLNYFLIEEVDIRYLELDNRYVNNEGLEELPHESLGHACKVHELKFSDKDTRDRTV